MSKNLILEIFDPSAIPNKTGLSGEFLLLFYSRTQNFFFEKGGQKGSRKRF